MPSWIIDTVGFEKTHFKIPFTACIKYIYNVYRLYPFFKLINQKPTWPITVCVVLLCERRIH